MSKKQQLERIGQLLSQALNVTASLSESKANEIATHIKKAIHKTNEVAVDQSHKKSNSQSQFENWWGNIRAGIANQPAANTANQPVSQISAQSQMKRLNELNSMISKEKSKLEELEKEVSDKIEEKPLININENFNT